MSRRTEHEDRFLIDVRDLDRRYGRVAALDGVSLRAREGEWLVVMGPSGSGKTTLLNALAGLDRPTGGRVAVAGTELSGLSSRELARFRRRTVGLVFQEFHLIPYLTALENVMLAQYVHSLTDREEARKALERVGLGERVAHLPSELSGGEKQRVCVARALINHPRLVLADEPTGNLDEANERQVLEIFRDLHRRGQTLVVATHNPEIAALADRVLRLEHGRVVAVVDGTDDAPDLEGRRRLQVAL
ncbi:MAG: ABC transporter ATP-binding protein [Thermoanaerobaculia bacterium]